LNYDLSQSTTKDYEINFQFKNNSCDVNLKIVQNTLYINTMKFSFPSNNIIVDYGQQKKDTFFLKENLLNINDKSTAMIETYCLKGSANEFLRLTNIPLTLTGDHKYSIIIER